MAASINNNWVNMRSSNYMARFTQKIANNVTRLSGNTKFATGADNPAGYAFAQRTRSSALASAQVIENIQNAQTKLKIADSAYGSMLDILSSAKDVVAQAAGTGGDADSTFAAQAKSAVDAYYGQIGNIASAATFNGDAILGSDIKFDVGGDKAAAVTISALTSPSLTAPADIGTQSKAQTAIGTIQTDITTVLGYQGTAAATANALGYLADFANAKAAYMQEAAANAGNVNITTEFSDYVSNQIALQSAQFIAAQQNQNAYSVLNLLK